MARKLIWTSAVSVDGYMEGPNREIDWHAVDEELLFHMNDWLGRASTFLEGRVTYELMEGYWPTADQDPDASPAVVEFAGIWRNTPKLVYTRTLERVGPKATVVRHVAPDEVLALKADVGGYLVLGGAHVAAEFARLGLIDEYRLYVHPRLIGRGHPVLQPSEATSVLRLIDTRTFGNGVVLLHYEVQP